MHLLRRLVGARPAIEPQVEAADCGYVCISAVLALMGEPRSVDEIKRAAGTTSRGLTIKQVRDGLGQFGVRADAVFFDKNAVGAFPDLGILLLDRGHFIVVAGKRGHSLEIYDPVVGWSLVGVKRLRRSLSGFGILIRNPPAKAPRSLRLPSFNRRLIKSTLEGRYLWKALGLFALAQVFALVFPLVSMKSVDASISKNSLGMAGIIIVGFLALSFINALSSTVGELIQARLKQKMYRRLGGVTFDSILAKEPGWFENLSGATIHNQINSLQKQLDFIVEGLRTGTTLAIGIVAGLAALLFISPWLAIPGLVSLVMTTILDIVLTRRQRGLMSASVEATQRRQGFVFGTLVQMPLIVRHGAVRRCRAEYVRLMARVGTAAGALQILQGWRTTLTVLLKSSETLVFVTLAAWFMSVGDYSIGGFVALGAYKDLLAGALASAFQLVLRYNALAIHRMQAGRLLDGNAAGSPAAGTVVTEGDVSLCDVSYRYGSLDSLALRNVSVDLQAGRCLIIKGASGSGKSTLAKLLTGIAPPLDGQILIDGKPLAYPVSGLAAVLQTDCLISGSIRENIALYRPQVTDSEIWKALEICCGYQFVRNLPMRLNSVVAEGMAGLSGGQKQRLLLARAVVGRPKVLVLDEATASLDVETESTIMKNLRRLGMTMIVISHRPEVWSFGDKSIEISAGELTPSGDIPIEQANIA